MGTVDYDSLLTHTALSPLETTDLFAKGLHEAARDVAGVPRDDTLGSSEWTPLLMLVLLGVLAYMATRNSDYILYRTKRFFSSERKFAATSGNVVTWEVPYNLILTVVAAICTGLLAGGLIQHPPFPRGWAGSLPTATLLVSLFFFLFIGLKSLIYSFINWVFFSHARDRAWQSDFFFLTSMTSYVIYLLAALLLFVGIKFETVAICLLITLILYKVLLFYRLKTNFQPKRYGVLLIFLYFCSVEIMPSLIVWHFCDANNIIF